MEALTIEELKQMAGEPVWCPDEEAYGIVICDNKADTPGFHSCMVYGITTGSVLNLSTISSAAS